MNTRTITAIEIQKKDPNRISVFLDGEFAFGLHQDVLLECGIAKGDLLSDERIQQILDLEERKRAREKALRLLAVRARSRKELGDRLKQAKFGQSAVEWALAELERLGLIDDGVFARAFGQTRAIVRPSGAYLLRLELRQKGLCDEDVEKGVAAAFAEKNERDQAFELAGKRKRTLAALSEEKARKRLNDFLLRRGFSWDLVTEIMEAWDQL